MARISTTHIKGALYYVTSRGDNHQSIFKDKDDYLTYIELLKKYKQQYGFKLFSFVLLDNHLHLLIELRKGITISDITRDLNGNYTKYFNAKFQRKGHLFQERYRMTLVEKESYLLLVSAYMHLNPEVLESALNAKNYSYSSYQAYLYYTSHGRAASAAGLMGLDLKKEAQEALSLLPEAATYENFLKALSKQQIKTLGKNLRKKAILGSEKFVERIKAEAAAQKAEVNKTKKVPARAVVFSGVVVLALSISIGYLLSGRQAVEQPVSQAQAEKEKEFSGVLSREKEALKRQLKEKYQADLISSQALTKRLLQLEQAGKEELRDDEN
jgi:REP element-mobilizing transposase RayT